MECTLLNLEPSNLLRIDAMADQSGRYWRVGAGGSMESVKFLEKN